MLNDLEKNVRDAGELLLDILSANYRDKLQETNGFIKTEQENNNDFDMVSQPPHYKSESGVECIDAIQAALSKEQFIGFLRGQIIKYTWRLGKKDDALQDNQKAIWYANKLNSVLGNKNEK